MFENGISKFSEKEIKDAFLNEPNFISTHESIIGVPIGRILISSGLVDSKSKAEKLIQSGGIYLNGIKINSSRSLINESDLIHGSLLFLRSGKSNYKIVSYDKKTE